VAVTVAMNRDLQFRFRLATLVGLGAALATWLLTGYLRFDGADSLGTAVAGALAFGLVTTAVFVAPYLVPHEWRVLDTVFSVSRRSSRIRREAFGDGSVPATPRQAKAWLGRHAEDTVATRGARVWANLVVGDLETARDLAGRMADSSAGDRFHRSTATTLVRLVEGGEPGLDDLRARAADLDDEERQGAEIDIGLLHALVAAADGGDWRGAILALRDRVDGATSLILVRWFLPVVALIAAGTVAMALVAYAFSSIVV
jgi:hypothetical protein